MEPRGEFFANATTIDASSLNISNNYIVNTYVDTSNHHCTCGIKDSSGNSPSNRTDISMENVANQSVHLHLQHIEFCKFISVLLQLSSAH